MQDSSCSPKGSLHSAKHFLLKWEHYKICVIYNASHWGYPDSLVWTGFWELHTDECVNQKQLQRHLQGLEDDNKSLCSWCAFRALWHLTDCLTDCCALFCTKEEVSVSKPSCVRHRYFKPKFSAALLEWYLSTFYHAVVVNVSERSESLHLSVPHGRLACVILSLSFSVVVAADVVMNDPCMIHATSSFVFPPSYSVFISCLFKSSLCLCCCQIKKQSFLSSLIRCLSSFCLFQLILSSIITNLFCSHFHHFHWYPIFVYVFVFKEVDVLKSGGYRDTKRRLLISLNKM